MQQPPCPITGAAPIRHVQQISIGLIRDLWRILYRVDVGPSFGNATRLDIWESPTGLYYFDPLLPGDSEFYKTYYASLIRSGHYVPGAVRAYTRLVAREIKAGERVLDVGCGLAGFRTLIPDADYLGLDPNFSEDVAWARAESLADHLTSHRGQYDVACIFDVLEHLSDPAGTIRDMADIVRRGGRVIVTVPHVPSAAARIPNFLLNAPPHHLTWWTEGSLRAVAAQAGLQVERIQQTPWCEATAKIYWIERFTPIKTGKRFFWHSWLVHASNLIGTGLGLAANKIVAPPKDGKDEGAGLLMIAHKPN